MRVRTNLKKLFGCSWQLTPQKNKGAFDCSQVASRIKEKYLQKIVKSFFFFKITFILRYRAHFENVAKNSNYNNCFYSYAIWGLAIGLHGVIYFPSVSDHRARAPPLEEVCKYGTSWTTNSWCSLAYTSTIPSNFLINIGLSKRPAVLVRLS